MKRISIITKQEMRNQMKRMLAVIVFSVVSSLPTWATQQTMTGEISDSMCGVSHSGMGDMGKNPKDCTTGCVKAGGKYVFVSKGKVYGIQNQDFSTLAANAGAKVQVTGDVDKDGKNITLSKLARAQMIAAFGGLIGGWCSSTDTVLLSERRVGSEGLWIVRSWGACPSSMEMS